MAQPRPAGPVPVSGFAGRTGGERVQDTFAEALGAGGVGGVRPGAGEVQVRQPHARQSARVAVLACLLDQGGGPGEHHVRVVAVTEVLQHVGDAVRAVQQSGPGHRLAAGHVAQPALVPGEPAQSRGVERVQHTGGAVGETRTPDPELFDVTGEQPVGALRGGGGEDRRPHGLAHGLPVGVGRVEPAHAGPGHVPGRRRAGRGPRYRGRHGMRPVRRPGDGNCGGVPVREHPQDVGAIAVGNGEARAHRLDELTELGGGQFQQRVQRQEQPQLQRGERVLVDVGAGPVARRAESRRAQRGALAGPDGTGEFEVDEADRVVLVDHDVQRVQVAEHDTAGVDPAHGGGHRVQDGQCPAGVGGDVVGSRVVPGERVVTRQPRAERAPRHVLHREELVLPHGEQLVHLGHAGHPGEPGEHVVLGAQSRHRVHPRAVEPRVRPGLLEHDLRAVRAPLRLVDAATVGEVQRAQHPVRHTAAGGPPCPKVRGEAVGHLHPVGYGERRPPVVGDRGPVRSGDAQDAGAAGLDPLLGERAVTDEQWPVAVAEVGQDVGAGFAGQLGGEFVERAREPPVVLRIEGHRLSARRPRRILGILRENDRVRPEVLERETRVAAVSVHFAKHPFRVVRTHRDVNFPPLPGQFRRPRDEHSPDPEVLFRPVRTRDGKELGEAGVLRCRGAPLLVEEQRVREAEGLVPEVHPEYPSQRSSMPAGARPRPPDAGGYSATAEPLPPIRRKRVPRRRGNGPLPGGRETRGNDSGGTNHSNVT